MCFAPCSPGCIALPGAAGRKSGPSPAPPATAAGGEGRAPAGGWQNSPSLPVPVLREALSIWGHGQRRAQDVPTWPGARCGTGKRKVSSTPQWGCAATHQLLKPHWCLSVTENYGFFMVWGCYGLGFVLSGFCCFNTEASHLLDKPWWISRSWTCGCSSLHSSRKPSKCLCLQLVSSLQLPSHPLCMQSVRYHGHVSELKKTVGLFHMSLVSEA